jgi:hypothetical protein
MEKRIEELLKKPEYFPTGAKGSQERRGADGGRRGRKSMMGERIEKTRQLFKESRNQPLYYKEIMKEVGIKSERNFYQIASEILQPTGKPGHYVLWRGGENTDLVERNSEELKGFADLRSSNRLYGFIPRKSELPQDSVIRALQPGAPPYLTDDKRFPPPFSRNPDRLRGAVIYGVKSEKASKNKEDAENLLRLLTHATGFLNLLGFMSLLPEAFMLAFRNRKVGSDLLEGSRPFSKLSHKELEAVKKFAFGSAQRSYVLYTFDVNEAFDWFFQNRTNEKVVRQLQERLREFKAEDGGNWGERKRSEKPLRETMIHESQMGEMLTRKLERRPET